MTTPDANPPAFDFNARFFVRQEAHLFAQIDRCRDAWKALLDYEAARARTCWDEDRRHEAEVLGAKLSRRPAPIRSELGQTRHGTLWLIDQWKALGTFLDAGEGWGEAQRALAFDLLGVSAALRRGDPWTAAGLDAPRRLVEREVAALESRLARHLDALDQERRQAAAAGAPIGRSAEERRIRRDESDCWRRLLALQRRATAKLPPIGVIDADAPEAGAEAPAPEAEAPRPTAPEASPETELSLHGPPSPAAAVGNAATPARPQPRPESSASATERDAPRPEVHRQRDQAARLRAASPRPRPEARQPEWVPLRPARIAKPSRRPPPGARVSRGLTRSHEPRSSGTRGS